MYGFFAKMTPINRHGLLSLALSVFDGPQEKTVEGAWGGLLYTTCKQGGLWRSTNCCQSKMTSHSRVIIE